MVERIFPHMSPVQTVRSPLPSTQIKRRSPNETQMWNVSAQLDLRQLGSPGTFVPRKPQYSRDNLHHATPAPVGQDACRLDWKENASARLSAYLEKSAPTRGENQQMEEWRRAEGSSEKGSTDEDVLKVALQPIKIAAGFRDPQVVGA